VSCDPYQTTWHQFGCFAATPAPDDFLTVTAQQRQIVLPHEAIFSMFRP